MIIDIKSHIYLENCCLIYLLAEVHKHDITDPWDDDPSNGLQSWILGTSVECSSRTSRYRLSSKLSKINFTEIRTGSTPVSLECCITLVLLLLLQLGMRLRYSQIEFLGSPHLFLPDFLSMVDDVPGLPCSRVKILHIYNLILFFCSLGSSWHFSNTQH